MQLASWCKAQSKSTHDQMRVLELGLPKRLANMREQLWELVPNASEHQNVAVSRSLRLWTHPPLSNPPRSWAQTNIQTCFENCARLTCNGRNEELVDQNLLQSKLCSKSFNDSTSSKRIESVQNHSTFRRCAATTEPPFWHQRGFREFAWHELSQSEALKTRSTVHCGWLQLANKLMKEWCCATFFEQCPHGKTNKQTGTQLNNYTGRKHRQQWKTAVTTKVWPPQLHEKQGRDGSIYKTLKQSWLYSLTSNPQQLQNSCANLNKLPSIEMAENKRLLTFSHQKCFVSLKPRMLAPKKWQDSTPKVTSHGNWGKVHRVRTCHLHSTFSQLT